MIPVEYLWLMLIGVFGIVGMVRGLWKELGVTTVLLISLFVLIFGWEQIGSKILDLMPGELPETTTMSLYYTILILFIGFVSYEGFTLKFPIKEMKGLLKGVLGLPGGLLNGYLIVGTIWDVTNRAKYYNWEVPYGTTGTLIAVSDSLTNLHHTLTSYLPTTFLNEFVLLVLGMILLLIMLLK
ncbi:MAG: hypothetical protein ACUVWZ_04630 [Anaerolineae bacterium]